MGLEDLLATHHAEVGDHPETPLLPDWPRYRQLERVGVYKAMLALDGSKLVGYNAFFVQAPLRCSTAMWAINDVLYLRPEDRKGINGVRLIAVPEWDLFDHYGVTCLIYPGVSDTLAKLLGRLKYKETGRVMSKVL